MKKQNHTKQAEKIKLQNPNSGAEMTLVVNQCAR
jgi:hypothetical protein